MYGCDPLALTTAINTLAVTMAQHMSNSELAMAAVILSQLGDTLETIAAQREFCAPGGRD